jgi:hypothetical protein
VDGATVPNDNSLPGSPGATDAVPLVNGAAPTNGAGPGTPVRAAATATPAVRARTTLAGDPDRDGPDRPRPTDPRLRARPTYLLGRLLRPNPGYRRVAAWLERSPRALRLFTAAERRSKEALFGCQMCGQCALPATGYACPMSCPKQLRNGPCGGVSPEGNCEVYPTERCVWVIAYERAESAGHAADLALLQRPVDRRQVGSSSWVNYWLGRDEDLWTGDAGLDAPSSIRRTPVDLGLPTVAPPRRMTLAAAPAESEERAR